MNPDQPRRDSFLTVMWRRKWIVIATVVVFLGVSAGVSLVLPKVYETSSTLIVASTSDSQDFDSVQVAQTVARSYGDILRSPNIADLVAARLGGDVTGQSVAGKVSIEPLPETQLLKITAADSDPQQAKAIADAYASVFVDYQRRRLATITQVNVSLADAAPVPDAATRPQPMLYTALGGILGLLAGIGLALLRERFDSRLRTPEEIEAGFKAPVLARVPPRGRNDSSREAFTEAFRVLRTNLQFSSPNGHPPKIIAVTSPAEREGKTTLVTQLALASATTGQRVRVVEADQHGSALQAFFRRDEGSPLKPGLSNLLVGGVAAEDVVHRTGVPGVDLVPAGPAVPSLAGLLESERGPLALAELAETADLVILDCPPLDGGADAPTLAGRADGVILVVDLDRSGRGALTDAVRRLESVRAKVIGFVLNQDDSPPARPVALSR